VRYGRDFVYSAFATTGATPTSLNETLNSYGEITVVIVDGIETAARDDRVREEGVEVEYQFRSRVRVGVTA